LLPLLKKSAPPPRCHALPSPLRRLALGGRASAPGAGRCFQKGTNGPSGKSRHIFAPRGRWSVTERLLRQACPPCHGTRRCRERRTGSVANTPSTSSQGNPASPTTPTYAQPDAPRPSPSPPPQRRRTRLQQRQTMARPGQPLRQARHHLPRWRRSRRDHHLAERPMRHA